MGCTARASRALQGGRRFASSVRDPGSYRFTRAGKTGGTMTSGAAGLPSRLGVLQTSRPSVARRAATPAARRLSSLPPRQPGWLCPEACWARRRHLLSQGQPALQ